MMALDNDVPDVTVQYSCERYWGTLICFTSVMICQMFFKVSESVARILLIQHDWNTEKILER